MDSVGIKVGINQYQGYRAPGELGLVGDYLRIPNTIPEYIILSGTNLIKSKTYDFNLGSLPYEIYITSVWIDAPTDDKFTFQIIDNGAIIYTMLIDKDQTPMSFPAAALPNNLIIRVIALEAITLLRIYAIPCKIIRTILAVQIN
jgi:hypothetical protein